jgi:hypothetical protein
MSGRQVNEPSHHFLTRTRVGGRGYIIQLGRERRLWTPSLRFVT